MIERCNRLTAFAALDDLIPRLEITAEDRLFGTETELESVPLADALMRRIAQSPARTVVLWLHGEWQDWEFDEWPGRMLAETWGPRGTTIRFVVRSDALGSADLSARQSLARLVQRCHTAELVEFIDNVVHGTPVAALLDDKRSFIWASRDTSAGEAGNGWGRSPTAAVVRGPVERPLFGKTIEVATLLSSTPETAVVEIGGGADGTASGFGLRLRRALDAESGARALLRSVTDDSLKEIIYTDRYVFSPLTALLVAELVGAFARRSDAKIVVRTRGTSKTLHASPPWQVQHDWTTQSDRVSVLHKLLSRFSEAARVNLDDATPHRRTLVLKSEQGALELTLDQGMGPWQPADRYRFDFGNTAEEQTQTLLKAPLRIMNAAANTFVVIRKISLEQNRRTG